MAPGPTPHQDRDLVLTAAKLIFAKTESLGRTARFLLRTAFMWKTTTDWLAYMAERPALAQAPDKVRSVLADKIHRPFARCALTVKDRCDLLKQHYDLAAKFFPVPVLRDMIAGKRLVMATLQGPEAEDLYTLTLSREMLSQHQGELAFLLLDHQYGIPLARLVVNLMLNEKGEPCLLLNGIQGPGPEYKGRIVRVTRDLDGLRPKRAVLEAAYAFAQTLGIKEISAISKANHVSQAKEKWQRKIMTDYDSFWQEFEPEPMANGDFRMPLVLPRRNAEDVPGKKRKLWLRRQDRLTKLTEDTAAALARYMQPTG